MAATQAEAQREAAEQPPTDGRGALLQNGTEKGGPQRPQDVTAKAKSPMGTEPATYRNEIGHELVPEVGGERPSVEPYGPPYRGYPDGDAYAVYGGRPGFPGKMPRPPMPGPPQRFISGQAISQPAGPTPTLNSLLQSGGAPPHRYPNSYEQPPAPYGQAWGPPRPMAPYSPQPYRNPSPGANPRCVSPVGGVYGSGGGGVPPSAGGYAPPGAAPPPASGAPPPQQPYAPYVPQRYPPQAPPGPRPFSPHQYEQGPSPQASPAPQSPGGPLPPGAPSPQPPQSPHSHHQQHQPYPPPRPPQPSTPNAHDTDSELSGGQNSNEGIGVTGGPGLVRPSPSPTGSAGSRSMSPAVGQQNVPMPPRPSSRQSDGSGPTSRMPQQAGVGGAAAVAGAPPAGATGAHRGPPAPYAPQPASGAPPAGYKMPPHLGGPPAQAPYPHHYPQANYSPRPYGPHYGPPPPTAPPVAAPPTVPPAASPGAPRPAPNHHPPYPPAPYQQWGAPTGARPPQHPHYLKQHLAHKMPPGSGPVPPHMGPPHPHHSPHPHAMGPPPPGPPPDAAMPPPSVAPNSHTPDGPPIPSSHPLHASAHDNGPATTVTSVVTTGPDGAPLDEGSQQSTLSNASAASGEDPGCVTPKSTRKDSMLYSGGPQGGPSSGPSPSPGAAGHVTHEDYDASPSSWPRTPSSPVFNSHIPPQETYRSKSKFQKSDSLGKLYEMDDSPERRGWVERLLAFMEERRTPIAACPTISKQPLDLYRLYLLVRDRGGFVEVTKNKTWKDIAGLLGIGASSSAAYTLRKHYTKNLLAYECHFDRGGIDPQPIINQVESTTKKKAPKANSVPSPGNSIAGSSNSQDSFPGGGAGGPGGAPQSAMDGYGPQYGGYPPPNSQQQGYQQVYGGYDQYGPPYSTNRSVYPPYGEQDNRYPSSAAPGGEYRYSGASGPGAAPGGPGGAPGGNPPNFVGGPPHQDYYRGAPHHQQHEAYSASGKSGMPPPVGVGPPGAPGASPSGAPRRHPDFTPKEGAPGPPPAGAVAGPPAGAPGAPPTHRPAPHGQQYGGWPSSGGPPGQYVRGSPSFQGQPVGAPAGAVAPTAPGAPQWGPQAAGAPRPPPPGAPQPPQPQWGPPQPYQQQQGQNQWGSSSPNQASGQIRPSSGPLGMPRLPTGAPNSTAPGQPYVRPDGKFVAQPGTQPAGATSTSTGPVKREVSFPPDSVEAVTPVLYKRRRLNKTDVAPIDAWRIMMALKSGLLAETCWALDILNILLFDDNSVTYFGLQHLPGLLDLLLEHFQKSLSDIFDAPNVEDEPWFLAPPTEEKSVDLGAVRQPPDPKSKTTVLSGENYTTETRKGAPVIYKSKEDDLFILDHKKDWDPEGESVEDAAVEPWQFGGNTAFSNHVMPCFQGEFVHIPFARVIDSTKRPLRLFYDSQPGECDKFSVKKECEKVSNRDSFDNIIKSECVESNSDNCGDIDKKSKRTKKLLSLDLLTKVKTESEVNGDVKEGEEREDDSDRNVESRHNGPTGPDDSSCIEDDNLDSEPMELEKDLASEEELKLELKIRDPAGSLKRRRLSDYEDECYTRDEPSLNLLTESRDSLAKRCICLSNILRSLTFVPGNETEFSRNSAFLALAGKLLLLQHEHAPRAARSRAYEREDCSSCCSSLRGASEWWWDTLAQLREDALVCCANIAGRVELAGQPEAVARPLLDGLLHWASCPAAAGQDALPHAPLSPRRLALEALCKLCVTDANVDLVLATPPRERLQRLCCVLARNLCRTDDQVLREFSVNLLHYLAAADSGAARTVALQSPTVSQLVAFIEQAEQSALGVANQHGIAALRDNPDSMGTSLDMLRRAAGTLLHLAKHPDNRPLFVQQEQRLLSLVMSQILDQKVAAELAKVLFQCSRKPRRPSVAE